MDKNITIDARRWFQKTYGNTYHSVKVYVDNKLIGSSGETYGYGESYLQTAHIILADYGIFSWEHTKANVPVYRRDPKTRQPTTEVDYWTPQESMNQNEAYNCFLADMREHRERYHITCVDVARERDL